MTEAQTIAPLKTRIAQIMQAAGKPLRAADIAKTLKAEGREVNASAVNSELYNGGFEKVSDVDGKPFWAVRPAPIRISGLGTLLLDPEVGDDALLGLMSSLSALVIGPKKVQYPAEAPRFGVVAAAAEAAGFAVN